MTKSSYFCLKIRNIAREEEDLLTDFCFDAGAGGMEETLDFHQNPNDYSVATKSSDRFDCNVYFTTEPGSKWLEELRSRWPHLQVELRLEANKDWLAEWKKGFKPFLLVEDVWVVPSWCERPTEAKHVIWMDPGMAFGTGTHETTQLAAQLLAKAIVKRPGARVLDVGTGTGILAILARHLGATTVVGTDVDPEAVRVAHENLELNKIKDIEVSTREIGEAGGPFDIVVANIIDGVLTMLQKPLKAAVESGGALVLSGIIDERREHFAKSFKAEPLTLTDQRQLSEWHGLLLERA